MGDGLKRAGLAAVMSRGPWDGTGSGSGPAEWTLTGAEVGAVYDAIERRDMAAVLEVLGVLAFSHRKVDRAVQLLRRAGLVRYSKAQRLWVVAGGL